MSIEASSVYFSYQHSPILENISFRIKDGDFVALIGPNGAGKTTLLKLILNYLKPDKGKIKLFNKDIGKFGRWDLVGYVPQRYSIEKNFPGTVKELLSLSKGESETSKMLGVEQLYDKKFVELSGGQQQRVLIAMALSSKTKMLMLDEPAVGVDIEAQGLFYSLLKKLNKEKKITIILVTHDVGLVPKYAKTVLCINHNICCMGHAKNTKNLLKKVYAPHFEIHHHQEHD